MAAVRTQTLTGIAYLDLLEGSLTEEDSSKRTPVLSKRDTAIGAVGSVVLAALLGGIGIYGGKIAEKYLPNEQWVTDHALPILASLLLVCFLAAAFLAWFVTRLIADKRRLEVDLIAEKRRQLEARGTRRKGRDTRRVVLFITPCPDGQFYLQYLSALVRGAAQAGGASLQMHISIYSPAQAFEDDFLPEHALALVEEYPAQVSGVFMIPALPESEASKRAVTDFAARYPATVLLDVYPGAAERLDMPPFVGGNEVEGGKLAAIIVEQYLKRLKSQKPLVLVLIGRNTSWERQRVDSFKQLLTSLVVDAEILVTEGLDYSRERARDLIVKLSRSKYALGAARPVVFADIAVIYACNDEMAIGALEAVEDIARRDASLSVPRIVGYDGTSEMMRLIGQQNPYVLGTINVNVEEQAKRAVGLMSALLRGQTPQSRWNLVTPQAVTNDATLGQVQ
jgi:ABC-type sugar transport system substrate-binding protein